MVTATVDQGLTDEQMAALEKAHSGESDGLTDAQMAALEAAHSTNNQQTGWKNEVQPISRDIGIAGMTGLQPSANDIPALLAQFVNGSLMNQPSQILSNPMQYAQAGAVGGNLTGGMNIPSQISQLLNSLSGGRIPVAQPQVPMTGIQLPQAQTIRGQIAQPLMDLGGTVVSGAGLRALSEMKSVPKIDPKFEHEKNIRLLDEYVNGKTEESNSIAKQIKAIPKEHQVNVAKLQADADIGTKALVDNDFFNAKKEWVSKANSADKVILSGSDAQDVVDGAVQDLRLSNKFRNFQTPAENALLDQQASLRGSLGRFGQIKSPEGIYPTESVNPDINMDSFKNFKNRLWNASGDESHVQAAIMKNFAWKLDEKGIEGFTGENSVGRKYASAFEKAILKKNLSKANLNGVANGRITPDNPIYGDMVRTDQRFGTNFTEQARKLFEARQMKQNALVGLKESNLKNIDLAKMKSGAHKEFLKFMNNKEIMSKISFNRNLANAERIAEIFGVGGLAYWAHTLLRRR